MSAEIPFARCVTHRGLPRRKGDVWFWDCQIYAACTVTTTMTPLVPQTRRQGRNHGNQQVLAAGVGVRRGGTTFQPEDGGTHRTGSIARRGQLRQEVTEKDPFGGTICPEQSDRNSISTGTGDGEDVFHHETVGGELGASRSMKTGQKNRLLGGIKKTKTLWEKWYETYQGGGETTEQQGRHSTVHRFL